MASIGSLASIFGTALGTILLALATGTLALSTARDVSATQEIARLTRADQEDRVRPTVIGTVTGVGGDAEGAFLSVELWNVGGGAAVRVEVTADSMSGLHVGTTTIATIVGGGSFPLAVRLLGLIYRADPDQDPRPEDFRVRGHYLDRRRRPVPEAIYDWKHDELPPTR